MKRYLALTLLILVISSCSGAHEQQTEMTLPPPVRAADNSGDDAKTILERYAVAWQGRAEMPAMKRSEVMALWVTGEKGGEFTVFLEPDGPARLAEGIAEDFSGGFRTSIETLRRLDRGEISAMTAMGRAHWSDPADMDPVLPPGQGFTPELQARFLPLTFHFWNRDWPEIIRFGEGTTRFVHGGNAAILYYDRGLRTAWYQLKEGMHVNSDPADQTNPFPSLFVVTRGNCRARLGGEELRLQEGMAVHVPAGMTHEFWAGPGEYGEVVLIMWGAGA